MGGERLAGWSGAVELEGDRAANAELGALLGQLKEISGLSYDKLAAAAHMSRGSVLSYVPKAGHRRETRTLKPLLGALDASSERRTRRWSWRTR